MTESVEGSNIQTGEIDLQALARTVCAATSGIEGIELVRLTAPSGCYLALCRCASAGRTSRADEEKLARELIERFQREAGLTIFPAFYSSRAWMQLEQLYPAAGWIETLPAETGLPRQVALQRALSPAPRALRRWLLRLLRDQQDVLSLARSCDDGPPTTKLELCLSAVEASFGLLLAQGGERFEPGRLLEQSSELVTKGVLKPGDAPFYLRLRGTVEQARRHRRLLAHDQDRRFEASWYIDRAAALLDRIERWVRQEYTSAAERQRARRLRWAGAGAACVLALAGMGVLLVSLRPRTPVEKPTFAAKAGGIAAVYYQGSNFEQEAFRRTDTQIAFNTGGALDPRLGPDRFSVRWRGYLRFRDEGKHELCVESDDGARLKLDGDLIAGDWSRHAKERSCGSVRVRRGWYPLVVEYFEEAKGASIALLRGKAGSEPMPVPPSDLCCSDAREAVNPIRQQRTER